LEVNILLVFEGIKMEPVQGECQMSLSSLVTTYRQLSVASEFKAKATAGCSSITVDEESRQKLKEAPMIIGIIQGMWWNSQAFLFNSL
jgi:hypothetical protein